MSRTIFTLGYEKRSLDEFIGILRDHAITVLVDVRETAWSHKPGFTKGPLRDALGRVGVGYVHARFAGNPKWLRDEADTNAECLAWYRWYLGEFNEIVEAFSSMVDAMVAEGERVCLVCFERHPDDCHRGIIAGEWHHRGGRRVEHLEVEGCERRVPPTAG